METNLILAGVGGQGILTIAQAISRAAIAQGLNVKQSEVHGMSQRGGAVQAHLRLANHAIHSDLIPRGQCDLIVSLEPLESLRYVDYLREAGAIITNTTPVVNIPNYPPVEEVLDRVAAFPEHLLVDAERLARAAGASRAVNAVLLGAVSVVLGWSSQVVDEVIAEIFAAKGAKIISGNQRALQLGRSAGRLYQDALHRGAPSRSIRRWIASLGVDDISAIDVAPPADFEFPEDEGLSDAEVEAVAQVLRTLQEEGRHQLYEHEVYGLVELVGAIQPPRHQFIPFGQRVTPEVLSRLPSDRVVLKIVSPDIVHKTEAGAVVAVTKETDVVNREIARLVARQQARPAEVAGVLVVEYVEPVHTGFGQELFLGVRSSREFGAILAAGLGGIDTEYLAHRMKPGTAIATALVAETTPEDFLRQFQKTAAYDIIAGKARGHQRVVSDGELLRCIRAFLAIGRQFCLSRPQDCPGLAEIEVNPFAFVQQRMVPLDGRGRLGVPIATPVPRPLVNTERLLEPRTMAIIGVSSKRENFGRIILENTMACGFPPDRLRVIKAGIDRLSGVTCVPSIDALDEPVDLLVVATASQEVPKVMQQAVDSGNVGAMILIPGGMGETESSKPLETELRRTIQAARQRPDRGPVVLGGNCLGIRSRPGRYDTFFIPAAKLDPRRDRPADRCALITQSGAFAITVMSSLESINPSLAITIGNQLDLTVSDMLRAVGHRSDIDAIGVYMEGFQPLDGLAFVRAVDEITQRGKTIVLYKAGKTPAGRSATAGHTASVAGDYEVCLATAAHAGAIVVDTFKEFEQVLEMATLYHDKGIGGRRLGIISNAGCEVVGMADAILGARYQLELAVLNDQTVQRIGQALTAGGLQSLVTPGNPLDLNPMADESVYDAAVRAMMEDSHVDAVVVSIVPFTPKLWTTPDELEEGMAASLAGRLPAIVREYSKPLVAVIDAGPPYDVLARALRRECVPVLPSCDQAIRSLGRFLCHRREHLDGHEHVSEVRAEPIEFLGAPLLS